MKKDLVIGSITGYDFSKIEPWVNSLDRSGFSGTKAMLCYNVDFDTVSQLIQRNYTVFAFAKDETHRRFYYKDGFSIVVERFLHLWHFLKKYKGEYRYIITTDVKDVIFQTNPSVWLEQNIKDKKINVACESIKYKDEAWGKNNMTKSFGTTLYDHVKDNLIYNCGTLSGEFDTMLDLFLNIYMVCNSTAHVTEGGGGPDQAALNILLGMEPYKSITNFAMSEDGWAAQLGTTGPQVKVIYENYLVEKSPVFIDDIVYTSDGKKPFALVHQYDRVPELKIKLDRKYR